MKQCEAKMEVYSRVCGFYRPVNAWNKGKKEEYRLRKTYKTFNNVPIEKIKEEEK